MMNRTEAESLYTHFLETRQERLRLLDALKGFFDGGDVPDAERSAYGTYIKRRIRPAAEQLIEQNEPEKLRILCGLGWFQAAELDSFILSAQKKGREALMMELLQLKEEKYGYCDRDFTI